MLLLKILHLVSLIVSLLFCQFVSSVPPTYDAEFSKWLYIPKFLTYFLLKSHEVTCDKSGNKCRYNAYISPQEAKVIITISVDHSFSQSMKEGMSKYHNFVKFGDMGFVNKHFAKSFQNLWPYIVFLIKERKILEYKVILVGHSLGGALATLTAAKLVSEGHKTSQQIFLYTYGAPRVGNPDFAKHFDEKIKYSWRVVFGKDVVPHFPKCAKIMSRYVKFSPTFSVKICDRSKKKSYYHHGREIWYPLGPKGKYKHIDCSGNPKNEDRHCSDMYNYDNVDIFKYKSIHYGYFDVVVEVFGIYLKEKYVNHCIIH
uniref:Lipase_3 domain-containing protein n=1 Tax=Strongyloides papillosus TaxID=174720 RepID=A0A0N5BV79_STREA